MKKRAADIIIDELVKCGIKDCFAVVGGGAMHLDNALAINKNIHKIFNHHEQACAMAAEAYARSVGRLACVCVTSGPGALNTLNGVAGAWEDSIPMIVLSGQVRYETSVEKTGLPLRCRGTQEFEIIDSVRNMTKYAVKIKNPLSVRREVHKAISISMSGRRGPVWLDVPLDVQSAIIQEDDLEPYEPEPDQVKPDFEQIHKMEELVKCAKRPCILAGSAIISSGVQKEFKEFISKVRIPIVGGTMLSDLLPSSHELYYGTAGSIGPRTGNIIIQNADVILVLGSSLSYRQTGFAQDAFAPKAKIVMVDIDKYESMKPGMRIACFINTTLKDFFDFMKDNDYTVYADNEWIGYCNKLLHRFSVYEGIDSNCEGRVCEYNFWNVYDRLSPDDAITALGNNTGICAKLQTGKRTDAQRVIANYTIGSMGYDIPAAIGCAIALKKEVICVTGDGSIMMNLQELQTIKYNKLPVKIVIFANDGYGAIRQTWSNFFNGTVIGCSKESGISFPDFKKVAEAFGFEYRCCAKNCEIEDAVKWLFEEKENVILELHEKYDDPLVPKVMSRMNNDGSFTTPALQDMYPFIDKDELMSFMLQR